MIFYYFTPITIMQQSELNQHLDASKSRPLFKSMLTVFMPVTLKRTTVLQESQSISTQWRDKASHLCQVWVQVDGWLSESGAEAASGEWDHQPGNVSLALPAGLGAASPCMGPPSHMSAGQKRWKGCWHLETLDYTFCGHHTQPPYYQYLGSVHSLH